MSAVPRNWFAWIASVGCLASSASILQAQSPPGPSPADSDASLAIVESAPIDTYPYIPVDAAPSSEPLRRLLPQDGLFRTYGWLDAGFIGNTSSPQSKFNGPYNAVDRSNEPMFNQAYLVAERALPTDGEVGVGARVDVLYGEDFFLAQSVGMELRPDGSSHWNSEYYGLALPQAYAIVGSEQANIKVGHFYSIVGYEGVMSPYNFFYSKSYSYQFAGPFTHWGGLGSWKATSNLEVQAGITNGWNGLDRTTDRPGFLGGVKYTDECKRWWSSFAVTSGDEFDNAANLPGIIPAYANRTRYSWIVDLTPTDQFEYLFHQWFGWQDQGKPGGGTALWYGVDQYAYYRLSETVRLGGRFEWFRDDDGTRIGLNRASNPNKPPFPGSAYSLSLGVNWTPVANLILRPEIRSDWFVGDVARQPYDDGRKSQQFMLGFDAIWQF